MGIWLVAGGNSRWAWRAALVLFSLFAAVSLIKALSGEATCGCFGRVEVNPWWTFGIDATAIAMLVRWRPARGTQYPQQPAHRRARTMTPGILLVGIPLGLVMASYRPAMISSDGTVVGGNGEIVFLDPEKWLHQEFPLTSYITADEKLKTGFWLVLFYRKGCPACAEAVAAYEALAREWVEAPSHPRVALIECPPFLQASAIAAHSDGWITGRLRDAYDWHVTTPVALLLDEGVVKAVLSDARDTRMLRTIWDVKRR